MFHSPLFSFLMICDDLSCLVRCLEFILTVAGDIWKPPPRHDGIEKIGGFVCPSFVNPLHTLKVVESNLEKEQGEHLHHFLVL